MRYGPTLVLACASMFAGGPTKAEGADVEQCYFAATVSKGDKVVNKPAALVKIGSDAKLAFLPNKSTEGPQLGLGYRVEETTASDLVATVTARVDGKDVASRTVTFTREKGASFEMEGGGYSWKLSVDLMTPAFLERLRGRKR